MAASRTLNFLIARNLAVVFIFVFLGKLAGAARELAVAWRFGISEVVDSYLFVFNIVQWPIAVLGGVLGSVLIPLAIRLSGSKDTQLGQFRAEILGVSIIVFTLISVMFAFFLYFFAGSSLIGLSASQAIIVREIAPILSSTILIAGIAQVLGVWVMVGGNHLNSLFEALPAVLVLSFVLIWQGVDALVWGTAVGFIAQLIALYLYLKPKGVITKPRFSIRSEPWVVLSASLGVMLIGQTLSTLTTILDQFYAVRLEEGSVSTLGYANRLLFLVLSLGALVVSRALLPLLSEGYREDFATTNRIVYSWSVLVFVVGAVVTWISIELAPEVLRLLFERGAFSAEDTKRVVDVFRYASFQIPFYSVSIVAVYALLSLGQYKSVAILGGVNLLVKALLAYYLTSKMGIRGLVLSTSGVYLIGAAVAFGFLMQYAKNAKSIGQ